VLCAAHSQHLRKRWLCELCNPYLGTEEQQGSAPEVRRLCIVVTDLKCTQKEFHFPHKAVPEARSVGNETNCLSALSAEIVEQLPTKLML
jgi:hypothetical protein